MNRDRRKVCFVVMGFGRKTDYESGRTLDLDATYLAIIAPAIESQGLRCIRSDEILQSGVIDTRMYEMLLRADLVIADISTGNVNAVYELGVRHGLRPRATIIMKEAEGRLYFDLNHVNTFEYEHLGADIGAREATRARAALSALISDVMQSSAPDSPVYTYLPKLQHPRLSDDEYEALLDETEEAQERLSHLIELGEKQISASMFKDAAEAYKAASEMKPNDPYILQRLALATYKSAQPSAFSALLEAHTIIQQLSPDTTNDPETTGLAGAIHKRIWKEVGDVSQLDMAIRYYRRGFELRRDYYNGENLATCFDLRANKQSDDKERIYDRMSAKKIRETLIDLLSKATEHRSFQDRSDVHWVYATLANANFALGNDSDGEHYEEKFLQMNPADWEKETYMAGKRDVMQSISN